VITDCAKNFRNALAEVNHCHYRAASYERDAFSDFARGASSVGGESQLIEFA